MFEWKHLQKNQNEQQKAKTSYQRQEQQKASFNPGHEQKYLLFLWHLDILHRFIQLE